MRAILYGKYEGGGGCGLARLGNVGFHVTKVAKKHFIQEFMYKGSVKFLIKK